MQRRRELLALQRGGRVAGRGRQPQQRGVVAALVAAGARGEAGEAEPRGDRVQPRPQPRLAAELAEPAVRAQERLLGDLLRLGAAAEHPERDAEHAMLVGDHESLECPSVARAEPGEERRLVGGWLTPT